MVTAAVDYNNKRQQLMDDKFGRITQHAHQVDMLLESSVRALQSLHDFAVNHLTIGQVTRVSAFPDLARFDAHDDYFELETFDNQLIKEGIGLIVGKGRLSGRSPDFYLELDMLHQMSLTLPVAKRMAPKASQIYYISNRKMMSVYPWPQEDGGIRESILHSPLFGLAQPQQNPERKMFWSEVRRDERGELITTLGMPVYIDNQFLGALFLDIELVTLANQIERYFDVEGMVLLLDDNNNLMSYPNMHQESIARTYQLSQKLPPALNNVPVSELINSDNGLITNDFYIRSMSMGVAPWRLLFMQPQAEMMAPTLRQLESTFLTVIMALSILVTAVHYLTRRAFVSPASQLLTHLERSTEQPQPPPTRVQRGWETWFELISRTFEENQQYTRHLAEQNRRLDKLVAKRTERLRLSNEQRERDFSLMRSLIDAIPEAIVFKDTSGRYLGCNKAAERMLGQNESEIIGSAVTEIDPSPRAAQQAKEDSELLEKRTPDRYQERVEIDGKMVLLDVLRLPFYNRRGELLGLISVWRDITREAQQQEQIRRSEQRYHLAMDAVEDGMWDWYLDSNQMICNPAYYTMLGYEADEFPLLIDTFYSLMHSDDRQRVERYIDDYLDFPEQAFSVEFRLRGKGGEYHWILCRGRAVEFDEFGEPLRLLGTNKDITQQKGNEVTLLEAKQDAELANRTKSEFLANMSHEIRTPMNAVLGMLELTLRTEVDDRQRDYLDKAKMSAASLLRIINDILDFSKIEAGKLELEQRDFSLDQVLEHVLSINAIKAQEKGVELLLYAPITAGLHVQGDSLRLGQVLVNLLSNAVKFTEHGEVELGCEDIKESNGRVSLKFWVRDTGIGITAAQQKRLFDAFSQADGSTTREYGGSGLGLSICKHLVAMMGGDIEVSSRIGEGTTFSFTIDALQVEAPQGSTKLLPEQLQGKAIVVDDNHSALQIYSTYLRDLGFQVETADNGADALNLIKEHQPVLVLIDWMMPEMDGLELVEQIHHLQQQNGIETVPEILMMTAYRGESVQHEVKQGRVHTLLQKPFKQNDLQDAVLDAFASKFEPAVKAEQPEPLPQTNEQAHILLVEDNLINQQIATELLKSAGYQVSLAVNGADAVQAVTDNQYDLVLMDIQMPVMDGLRATKEIRKSNTDIPIIAMTAHAMSGDRDKSLAAGMNDHITKPIVLPQLFEALNSWLNKESA
ncbi:response regulator [Ferrimonas lipolytica]|uniref:Sensory/regulatory protein RpfC n=2 Tax=Ferrimonas lipolytica TaxID=2724191 RepID=A0A6H1UM87_9GAMM|nr:response regulator [Ferrimonas lipolytica]